jgi:hypothetical protein
LSSTPSCRFSLPLELPAEPWAPVPWLLPKLSLPLAGDSMFSSQTIT